MANDAGSPWAWRNWLSAGAASSRCAAPPILPLHPWYICLMANDAGSPWAWSNWLSAGAASSRCAAPPILPLHPWYIYLMANDAGSPWAWRNWLSAGAASSRCAAPPILPLHPWYICLMANDAGIPGPGEIGCRPERPPAAVRHRQFSLYTYGICVPVPSLSLYSKSLAGCKQYFYRNSPVPQPNCFGQDDQRGIATLTNKS